VQLARHLGATVIASVSREDDVAAVRSLGAHHTLLRHAVNVPVEVKTLTDGHGADVIVETALSDNLNADLSALARGGRIVAVGSGSQPQVAVSSGTGGALDASLLFMSLTNAGRAGVAQILSKVTDMAEAGSVRAVIGSVLPLAEARRAHELMTRHHFGKIVLVP
jgi:NADPH:quinone reductase-like Zn-dependent oxidoreductase